jgi:hypothetical protein
MTVLPSWVGYHQTDFAFALAFLSVIPLRESAPACHPQQSEGSASPYLAFLAITKHRKIFNLEIIPAKTPKTIAVDHHFCV